MSDKQSWSDLAERCEKATGPDRKIDWAIVEALLEHKELVLPFTTCLTAINARIERELPGWAISVSSSREYGCHAGLSPSAPYDEWSHTDMRGVDSKGASMALALCAVFCRAMGEKSDD